MKYEKIVKAVYLSRPNRFTAVVSINGITEKSHVKNTGRLKELLVPGVTVFIEDYMGRMGTRKMRYSLIAVMKGDKIVNIDSQAPNKVVKEALENGEIVLPEMKGPLEIQTEKKYGNSRFDIYIKDAYSREGFIEIKGCTLENEGTALFPDAPTQRGVKHLKELKRAAESGYFAAVFIVIQMKGVSLFQPNKTSHREFADAMREAYESGVKILCCDCDVTENSIALSAPVPFSLYD